MKKTVITVALFVAILTISGCDESSSGNENGNGNGNESSCKTEGLVKCGSQCIDPMVSLQYCGANEYCENYVACKNGETCFEGRCRPATCNDDEHFYEVVCEKDSLNNCGAHDFKCSKQVEGWKSGDCVDKECIPSDCEDGRHPFENTCEPDDANHCGNHNTDCSVEITGWKAGDCMQTTCKVNECTEGSHVYNNTCESDTLDNCGQHERACASNIEQWEKSMTCIQGTCKVSQCIDGYHVDAQTEKCVQDTKECCGTSCSLCPGNSFCVNGECRPPEVGDIIEFGHYEQDNDKNNGEEGITWIILDKTSDGQYLIISEKVIDGQPFTGRRGTYTWDNSAIRSWLNGYGGSKNSANTDYTNDNFIDAAFTEEEKARIIESNVSADATPGKPQPGYPTTDKIFLLSDVEAQKYLSQNLRADTTRYALNKHVTVYGSESHESTYNGLCRDTHCYAFWWLRSPGKTTDDVSGVTGTGVIFDQFLLWDHGSSIDIFFYNGVRPALWFK